MADKLRVTELDFDTIKTNLKNFLKQQPEFTDYDFDGSSLSILLDILAYNTHYNAYYLNMIANESFLDTALLRNSVVSHAKSLGYKPYSTKSPVAVINLVAQSLNSSTGTLTLPKGFNFLSNQIDGKSYNYVILNPVSVIKVGTTYTFEQLKLREGRLITNRFVQDNLSNPKQIYTLTEPNIDTETITVSVSPSSTNTTIISYTSVDEVYDLDKNSEVFYMQEGQDGKYQIYFGEGILGKKIPDGGVISVTYLVTNGTESNKANNFVVSSAILDSLGESLSNFTVIPISAAAAGSSREPVDSVKLNAVTHYTSQNRLVTKDDYSSFILRKYPYINSVSVWGGEENTPPIYGKVFISLNPKENYYISETEKRRILNEIIKPYSIVSIFPEIIEPDYTYINLSCNVKYDKNKTNLLPDQIKKLVQDTILLYEKENLNKFGGVFVKSKIEQNINIVEKSIIGNDLIVYLEKRFEPELNKKLTYYVNFNLPIVKGTDIRKRIKTSYFFAYDYFNVLRECVVEEIPNSFSGVGKITVIDSGTGYTSTPTVTITGDGVGALAEAIIVNGRVESINIINRGINYTRAVVTITGGGGISASAVASINSEIGTLQLVYFNENGERRIINPEIGIIDYSKGLLTIQNLNVISVNSLEGMIKITAEPQSGFIETVKNNILTIDENDPLSLGVSVTST